MDAIDAELYGDQMPKGSEPDRAETIRALKLLQQMMRSLRARLEHQSMKQNFQFIISTADLETQRLAGEIHFILESGSVEEKASMLRLLKSLRNRG